MPTDPTPTAAAPTDPGAALPDPSLTFVFEARVEVDPAVRVGGGGPGEVLWFVPITGGTVEGPRFSGEVVPGGGDRYVDRDGVVELDARYLLRHRDGSLVDIHNQGFWHADPAVTARLDAGEPVPEQEYYYRTSARFRTDAAPHRWLTRTVVVGLARQEGATICIRFFAVT